LARTIYPTGHLHTFEFHEERARKAEEEFKVSGFESIITVTCGNVCTQGFGELDDVADAVFLDLPSPWEAVKFVPKLMKKKSGGKICSFSPCMEQVQRTIVALKSLGFYDIQMFEVLQRSYDCKKVTMTSIVAGLEGKKREDDMDLCEKGVDKSESSFNCLKPSPMMRGHTSFLTFASFAHPQ
jgi:tRNA (adenine57-N1/adenine58-N1)-methyltransferase